jgi:hypothetical protein
VIFVALCIWIVFCIRDFCLLQTGPASDFREHARWYAASVLVTAGLVCLAMGMAGPLRVREIALSPIFLGIAIACHLAVTGACLWLSHSGSHTSSWVLVLIPVPASWIFLVITATTVYTGRQGGAAASLILEVAVAWVILIAVAARLDHRETVPADDLDFSVRFAGWSNCMACCLVSLLMQ